MDADDHALGLSRRDFLKTVSVAPLAGSLVSTVSDAAAQSGPPAWGPGELPVTITVNGQRHQLRLEPRVTLLDALRLRLDITGAKRVCDRGTCGACTVIVDGRTYYACSLLAIECQGRSIRTVEGLAQGDALHPIQQALCDHDGLMCGFCSPGMVMAAVALRERVAAPTEDQVKSALDGNVCRCGADVGVVQAVLTAEVRAPAKPEALARAGAPAVRLPRPVTRLQDALPIGQEPPPSAAPPITHPRYAWPEQPRLLGSRMARVDAVPRTTGRARFTHDITRAGMLYGQILRSPFAHARVKAIDLTIARSAPGVRAVISAIEIGQKVMYAGDEVAAVAAVSEQQADDAIRLIKVEWEALPHLATVDDAMRPEAPNVFEPANVRPATPEEEGDLEAGFADASHIVEGIYNTQVQTHVSPETHGCVCEWTGDALTAWVSTQAVQATRDAFAERLQIPAAKVRVVAEFIGAGFGSKFGPDAQGVLCARLAREAKAPVKVMLSRKEEYLATGNRPSAFAKVRAGITSAGALTAFDADTWGTGGAGRGAAFPLPYVYLFPNRRRTHRDVYINAGPARPMRGLGHPQGCFITEVVMDELADAVRMDPVEVRLKNLPPLAPNAMWSRYFPLGAERIGWRHRHQTGDATPGPIKRGLGCAASRWNGSGRGTRAHCRIEADGAVVIRTGTQDIGTATRTIVAAIVAETLGLEPAHVRVEIGDSRHPFSGGSGGSTTAASVAPAVRVTAGRARDALVARLAARLGAAPQTIAVGVGRVHVGPKTLTWREACRLLGGEPIAVDGQWEAGLSSSGTSGVQFADVEVDVDTGITRIRKIVCVQDCGLILDMQTAESQCRGGVISGVNYALFEERILDRQTANVVNPNMEWYAIAGPSDLPEIDVVLVDQPSRGVIGIGEPPAVATAAAIANAVRNATGATIRSLPITPEKMLSALERAGGTN